MAAADGDLPRLQCRPPLRTRLGDSDVDRHRLRARPARARRAALSRPLASVPADGRRRRRHRRARCHRNRLHGHASGGATPCCLGLLRCRPGPTQRSRTRRARVPRPRGRRLGGPAQVGCGADRRRSGDGTPRLRLPGRRDRVSKVRRERFREFREQPTAGLGPRRRSRSSGRRRPPTNGCSSSFIPGRATSSCRCSHSRTRALPSTVPSWPKPSARRSRSGSWSGTSSASRSASSGARRLRRT